MRSSDPSLARRVGGTAAGAACVAAIATLGAAMAVVDHLERSEAREDALALGRAIARELDASGHRGHDALAAEVREFTHGGIAIAILGPDDSRLAGPATLPAPRSGACERAPARGTEWFVCAAETADGYRVLVGEAAEAVLSHRAPLLLGGAVALLVVLVGSVLAGVLVGRWSLRPLTRLEASVGAVDAANPSAHGRFERSGLREVDALARALEALLEQLSTELARSRRFAADAAHELRTPLSKLRAELELSAEVLPVGAEPREALSRMVARTIDLARLLDRLLLLASPEDAVRSETLASLAVVLETAVEALDPADVARVRVALDTDGLVMGDEAILRSVVANALDNALKYSDGEVRACVRREGDDVVLRVDDEGPGLRGEARERAFEPFYRDPRHRASPGHGVGLALIAHVIRAHGGSTRFLEDGPGAHLELRLPGHR